MSFSDNFEFIHVEVFYFFEEFNRQFTFSIFDSDARDKDVRSLGERTFKSLFFQERSFMYRYLPFLEPSLSLTFEDTKYG